MSTVPSTNLKGTKTVLLPRPSPTVAPGTCRSPADRRSDGWTAGWTDTHAELPPRSNAQAGTLLAGRGWARPAQKPRLHFAELHCQEVPLPSLTPHPGSRLSSWGAEGGRGVGGVTQSGGNAGGTRPRRSWAGGASLCPGTTRGPMSPQAAPAGAGAEAKAAAGPRIQG